MLTLFEFAALAFMSGYGIGKISPAVDVRARDPGQATCTLLTCTE